MTKILVDSSIWISFFKGQEEAKPLMPLIDGNLICINKLILSELIPSLAQRKEHHLIRVLDAIATVPLEIDWDDIIQIQTHNLLNGVNKVGIADILVAQNAIQNKIELFTLDQHFALMQSFTKLRLYIP